MHWKTAMDLSGAYQMGLLKRLFTDYPWYKLIPDQENALVVIGYSERGGPGTYPLASIFC